MLYPSYQKMLADARRRRLRALRLYKRPDGSKTGRTLREVGEIMGIANRQRVWELIQRAEMEASLAED